VGLMVWQEPAASLVSPSLSPPSTEGQEAHGIRPLIQVTPNSSLSARDPRSYSLNAVYLCNQTKHVGSSVVVEPNGHEWCYTVLFNSRRISTLGKAMPMIMRSPLCFSVA
jgi:hypothetical protein